MPDDDETVKEDWILRMLDCFQLDERIAVVEDHTYLAEITPPAWMPYDFRAFNLKCNVASVYSLEWHWW